MNSFNKYVFFKNKKITTNLQNIYFLTTKGCNNKHFLLKLKRIS